MTVQVITQPANIDTGPLINAYYASTQQTSLDQINASGRGVIVTLSLAALSPGIAPGSLTLIVEGKDSASGQYYSLLTASSVSVTNTAQTIAYTVHPTALTIPGKSVISPLPRTWRVRVVHNFGSTASYKVGASVIL